MASPDDSKALMYNGNSLAQQNCIGTTTLSGLYWQTDPYCELRQLVAQLKEAAEPKDAKVKRLEAKVAELEKKLADIKKAVG